VTCAKPTVVSQDGKINLCAPIPQDGQAYISPVPFAVFATVGGDGLLDVWNLYDDAYGNSGWNLFTTPTGDNYTSTASPFGVSTASPYGAPPPTFWVSGSVDIPTGPDSMAVQIYANSNAGNSAVIRPHYTVIDNPFPDMSSGTVFSDLELNATNWSLRNAVATLSAGATGSSSLTMQDETAPTTITGNTLTVTSTGTSFNTRAYAQQTAGTGQGFFLDGWFHVEDATNLGGLEFNVDLYDGTSLYSMAMKCDGTNWNFWNGTGWTSTAPSGAAVHLDCSNLLTDTEDVWTSDNYAGNPYPTDPSDPLPRWHHIQLYGTMGGGNVTYKTFLVDGSTVYGTDKAAGTTDLNNSFPAVANTAASSIFVGQTVDNSGSAAATASSTVYFDWINLTQF